jgi:hypothetical protein
VRLAVVIAATMGTAAVVSVSGLIGFVGIVVPHAVRLLAGSSYRRLLPLSLVIGAAFLILADIPGRVLQNPAETPIGVVTAFLGAPFFILVLLGTVNAVSAVWAGISLDDWTLLPVTRLMIEQVGNVALSTVMQDAWARGQEVSVHGWVYGLQDGLLKDLDVTMDRSETVVEVFAKAIKRYPRSDVDSVDTFLGPLQES